ncbi:uncharacterized protein LOC111076438 isoform X2 [Drosophila obscura]|uniref:uncharacterized protein LOC111076438 isoform X2 n=1 Tax=Drosophila obscura TaxID=7282 RepID=UPI001BB1F362|nr:uncharacterized protein LOC111076438 isoform X2 [Drosophila obscura]
MSVSKVTRKRSTKDRLVPSELGELSVFICSPSYHYRMNAADKEKNLVRLNISSVAQLKAKLCRPVKTKPPITSTPKRRYNARKKPQAAAGAPAGAGAKSGARPVKTSRSLPKSVPINKEKSVEQLTNVSNQLEYQEGSTNMKTYANDDRAGAGMGVVQPTGLSETDIEATVPAWEVCTDGQLRDNTSDMEEAEPNYDLILRELKAKLLLLLADLKSSKGST